MDINDILLESGRKKSIKNGQLAKTRARIASLVANVASYRGEIEYTQLEYVLVAKRNLNGILIIIRAS